MGRDLQDEYEIDDLVDAILGARQPVVNVPPPAPAAAGPVTPPLGARGESRPRPAPPMKPPVTNGSKTETVPEPPRAPAPKVEPPKNGGPKSGLSALEKGDDDELDQLVNAIVAAPRSPAPRSNTPAPRSGAPTPPIAAPAMTKKDLPVVGPAEDAPQMWSDLTPPPHHPPPRLSSQPTPAYSYDNPFHMGPTADIPGRPAVTADVPPRSESASRGPGELPTFDPPRLPPSRAPSGIAAPARPRPHSTADLEANTPSSPIDTSRMEQPTRPPLVGYTTTQPGSRNPDDTKHDLKPGHLIGERYRVIDTIGRGGVSVVYRVEHTLLLKRMALKVLRPELSQTPSVVDRFHREARLVCQLDDPHVVRVTDFGRMPEGSLFLVMDYVEGESLANKLRREAKLAPEAAVRIVNEILAGLAHAHEHGIVHRDLKPENIMVTEKNYKMNTKILDFGIAKLGDGDEGTRPITQAGTVFGTPRYMSPEQAAGEPVDKRTDIYTTGVILYELLTGRPPFDGETTVRILSKVLTQPPPPMGMTEARPYDQIALQAIVMRALSKEKADRFSTVQDFKRALETCNRV